MRPLNAMMPTSAYFYSSRTGTKPQSHLRPREEMSRMVFRLEEYRATGISFTVMISSGNKCREDTTAALMEARVADAWRRSRFWSDVQRHVDEKSELNGTLQFRKARPSRYFREGGGDSSRKSPP